MLQRAKRISDEQKANRRDMLLSASLASGQVLRSLYHYGADKTGDAAGWDFLGHRLTWNLAQSCVETAETRATKTNTRVRIQTFEGDYDQQQRAELLTKWLDGLFYEEDYYQEVAGPMFRDGAIFPGGVPVVSMDRTGVHIDRMMPFELLISSDEGMNGRPRNAYRVSVLPRDSVEDSWGDTDAHRDAIRLTPVFNDAEHRGDVIEVVEAFHIGDPASVVAEARKSRHMVAVPGGVLADDDWKFGRMPWPKRPFRYGCLPAGWWGQAGVFRIIGTQIELNKTLLKIQEGIRKMAGIHWGVAQGSKVVPGHLVNMTGSIISYVGDKPPVAMQIPGMPPEVYAHAEKLWQRGHDLFGLNELATSGDKPGGVTAASALREVQEATDMRFSKVMERFDGTTVDVGDLAIAMGRIAYMGKPEAMVRAPSTNLLRRIKWGDVNMKEDSYVVRAAAANLLPTTPSARIQKLQELQANGTIPPEAAAAMMDIPDVESAVAPGAVQYTEACREVQCLLDGDRYQFPDEGLRPDLAMTVGQAMYFRAKQSGAPPKLLANVQRWLDDNRERQASAMKAAMPPQGPAPMIAPPGPGMPASTGLEGLGNAPPMAA